MGNSDVVGFLKADGPRLINGEGRTIVLRGVGFGSWLLPEGYMWRLPAGGDRPRRIERMITELIGPSKAEQFWQIYYDRYITEDDIRQVALEGFNSVRLPINARFLIDPSGPDRYVEAHLLLLDRMITWCRTHSLYVILDLHGAPGGQTGANIDDSEHDQPELFTVPENQAITIALWQMLADRYKDEWIVAGYDLLNEPLPDWFSAHNAQVMPLYAQIIKAIRAVDHRHMIILEGVHWASDWSIFTHKLDDNLLLQFHKYWNNPDTESIQQFLDKRTEWNVPIFMGEGGENNPDWYTGGFQLFEDHDISWNFWTWKKMDTANSPCSIRMSRGWPDLVSYLEGGPAPDPAVAQEILWEYLDNLQFNRCDYHPEVVRALFRRPPVRIPAIFYGYRGDRCGIGQPAPSVTGFRAHDGTDIHFTQGDRTVPNFQHTKGEPWQPDERLCVGLTAGDWLAYEFTVQSGCAVGVQVRMCPVTQGDSVAVSVDGVAVGTARGQDTADWAVVHLPGQVRLEPGVHRVVLHAEGSIRVEWIELS